jgi:hypothetical protein
VRDRHRIPWYTDVFKKDREIFVLWHEYAMYAAAALNSATASATPITSLNGAGT